MRRHLAHSWKQTLHEPTVAVFEGLQRELANESRPLILDSGCGTGASTRRIARRHPSCLVIGVDKSRDRLARGGAHRFPWRDDNMVLLRAELTSFWRLALDAGWRLQRHFLLYPNPWPKPGQLQRRWHAHPVFPSLLKLGGALEMRTNWRIYAEEFACALAIGLGQTVKAGELVVSEPLSPFESKYLASGHALYSVSATGV